MNLTAEQIKKAIEKYPYWDERVMGIDCLHYGDQVTIYYTCGKCIVGLTFSQCYYVLFDHFVGFDKGGDVKELSLPQLPYFLHDIKIASCLADATACALPLFEATIDCSPLCLRIRFREFSIQEARKAERRFFCHD